MTKRNKPNVKIVAGNVSSINNGFTTASNKERIMATNIAEKISLMATPGSIDASIKTLTEQTNTLKSHLFMILNYNYFVKIFGV